MKRCLYCNVEFEDNTLNETQKYCSSKCKDKYYYWNHGIRERKAARLQTLKREVISNYSDGLMVCECCGEKHIEFLTIDHINNNGAEERKKVGKGHAYYLWLRRNNFPQNLNLRVLCMNCNHSYYKYGYCPHKKIDKNGTD